MQPATNGGIRSSAPSDDLLLRETHHRCSNDLQLVIGLVALQSRRAGSPEVGRALNNTVNRVSVLARARRGLHEDEPMDLNAALHQVCEALHAPAELRPIVVGYTPADGVKGLSARCVATLALVVNELATNAIKHAFKEARLIDDDGLPFPKPGTEGVGLEMGLAKRIMASIDGSPTPPGAVSKVFELRVPVRWRQPSGYSRAEGPNYVR